MNSRFSIAAIVCLFIFTAFNFAQSAPVQITGGRFLIKGSQSGEEPENAVLASDDFTAAGFLGGQYSPWFDICLLTPTACSFGKTFTVPRYPRVDLGGCVGDCHQFINGTFTINGTTYQNAYYRGFFDFSQETFFIHKMLRRKGTVTFRKPFTLTGRLQVCRETNIDRNCPAEMILFDAPVSGHGTLTVVMNIKTSEAARPFPYPYLSQQSFEYRFEP